MNLQISEEYMSRLDAYTKARKTPKYIEEAKALLALEKPGGDWLYRSRYIGEGDLEEIEEESNEKERLTFSPRGTLHWIKRTDISEDGKIANSATREINHLEHIVDNMEIKDYDIIINSKNPKYDEEIQSSEKILDEIEF